MDMKIIEELINELDKDTSMSELNIRDVQLKLPGIKHKYAGRLIRAKISLQELFNKRREVKQQTVDKLKEELNEKQPEILEEEVGSLIRAQEMDHPQILTDDLVDSLAGFGVKRFSNYFLIPENRELLKKIFKYKVLLTEFPGMSHLSSYIKTRIKKELLKRGVSTETIYQLGEFAKQLNRVTDENRIWWYLFNQNYYQVKYDPDVNYEFKYDTITAELKLLNYDISRKNYDFEYLLKASKINNYTEAQDYFSHIITISK